MSSTVESALRDMLAERAGDIRTLPARLTDRDALLAGDAHDLDVDHQFPEPRRRSRWLLVAAAVIVLAVAGTVIGIRGLGEDHQSLPASPTGRHTPSPTPTSTQAMQATCQVALPSTWTAALQNGSTLGSTSAMPLAVAANGDVLAARDFGSARDVVLVSKSGTTKRLYSVPDPSQNQVQNGSLEAHWALIPVVRLPRNANGVLPTVVDVVLVNTATGDTHTLDNVTEKDLSGGRTIDGATLQAGHVYWDVRPSYGSDSGTIRDYDLGTGITRTISTGRVGQPVATALGVSWSGFPALDVQIRASLPVPVAQSVARLSSGSHVATDGSAYAWVDQSNVLHWWAPGSGAPRSLRVPRIAGGAGVLGQDDLVVAGRFVSVGGKLIDTRTAAWAPLPVHATPLYAGDARFVGYAFTGSFKEPPTAVVTIDTATKPDLHC